MLRVKCRELKVCCVLVHVSKVNLPKASRRRAFFMFVQETYEFSTGEWEKLNV